MVRKEESLNLNIATLAISALRFLTPTLLAVLTFQGTQVITNMDKLATTMQNMQITVTTLIAKVDGTSDHEARIRQLERDMAVVLGKK